MDSSLGPGSLSAANKLAVTLGLTDAHEVAIMVVQLSQFDIEP